MDDAPKASLARALAALPDDVTFDAALDRLRAVRAGALARVHTKADVLGVLRAHGPALQALGVERVRLFGSFARDEAGPESDVDLLVDFGPERKTYAALFEAGELLEAAFGRRVELVTPDGLSPYLGPHILREAEEVDVEVHAA